jgi:hypothetical protein
MKKRFFSAISGGAILLLLSAVCFGAKVTPVAVNPPDSSIATEADYVILDTACSGTLGVNYFAYKIEADGQNNIANGLYVVGDGAKFTISNYTKYVFDWSANVHVCGVYVKGGPGGNAYRYPGPPPANTSDDGLTTPDSAFEISHITFFYLMPPVKDPTKYSISGMKFLDADKLGGERDPNVDTGLGGWTIELYKGVIKAGDPLATTTTGGDGTYSFTELEGGDYVVCEVLPAEWTQTFPGGDGCHMVTVPTHGVESDDAVDVDFGNYEKTYLISGKKFYDSKGLGAAADFLPGGLAGWTITIGKLGETPSSMVTGADGAYEFEVKAGTYEICEVLQAGYLQSFPSNGGCHEVTVGEGVDTPPAPAEGVTGNDFANYIKIAGTKWYETTSGPGVGNIKILVGLCKDVTCTVPTPAAADLIPVCTAEDGSWSLILPKAAVAVMVQEELPVNWEKLSPTTLGYTIPVGAANQMQLDFVNICYKIIRNTGGYTLGFWSNRNGQRIIVDNGYLMSVIAPLNLRDAAGHDVNFTTYAAFRTWLLGGTATNMAYMLSVQMAATALSVANTPALGGFEVTDPNGDTKTVAALILEASALLGGCEGLSPCLVTQSGELRTLMEKYKNIFDKLNNNSYEVRVKSETPCDNRSTGCPLPPTP